MGTAFIARVPFDSSSLIGNWTEDTHDRVWKLKELCAPYYPTLAEAALRFSLSDRAVSVVIPGMKTPEEVKKNIAYSDGEAFPSELLEKLKPHRWFRNFYL